MHLCVGCWAYGLPLSHLIQSHPPSCSLVPAGRVVDFLPEPDHPPGVSYAPTLAPALGKEARWGALDTDKPHLGKVFSVEISAGPSLEEPVFFCKALSLLLPVSKAQRTGDCGSLSFIHRKAVTLFPTGSLTLVKKVLPHLCVQALLPLQLNPGA